MLDSVSARELLAKAFAQRSDFLTCRFHLRTERRSTGRPPHVTNADVSFSHGRLLLTDLGDDDGIMFREAGSLRPAVGVASAFHPQTHYLDRKADSYWSHWASAYHAEESMFKRWRAFVDPRSPGMRSVEFQNAEPDEIAARLLDDKDMDYSLEKASASIARVIVRTPKGRHGTSYDYEWDIDITKGPAILACREFFTNKEGKRSLSSEAHCRLSEFDGVWWPIEVIRTTLASGNQVIFQYTNVEFNRPTHPQVLSPDSLGLPMGMEIRRHDHKGAFYYIGSGATVDQATWDQMKDSQDLTPLKQFRARMDALGDGQYPDWWHLPNDSLGLAGVSDQPDLWEVYVRRWALKHTATQGHQVREQISNEQRTAAQSILDECRKKAAPIRARLDAEMAKVDRDILKLQIAAESKTRVDGQDAVAVGTSGSSTQPSTGGAALTIEKQLAALQARRATLGRSPEIERIFDELKHRLRNSLTTKQSAATDGTNGKAQH